MSNYAHDNNVQIRAKDEEARAVSQSASWTRTCGYSIQTGRANVRAFALAMVSTASHGRRCTAFALLRFF
jgi:hypothetical protein